MDKKVYLETLGCSKNRVDSEIMLGSLNNQGYQFTDDEEEAVLIPQTIRRRSSLMDLLRGDDTDASNLLNDNVSRDSSVGLQDDLEANGDARRTSTRTRTSTRISNYNNNKQNIQHTPSEFAPVNALDSSMKVPLLSKMEQDE